MKLHTPKYRRALQHTESNSNQRGGNCISDELAFSDDHPEFALRHTLPPWQLLIVDDDPAVHEVTRGDWRAKR